MQLPQDHKPFIDKYFLRTRDILEKEGLNPLVRAQVFIRKGPGVLRGMDEAIDILRTYSDIDNVGGRIYALSEGATYQPKETLMVIEAPIQSIVELETMYLGVLAAETTKANDGIDIDPLKIEKNMRAVVDLAQGRPVSYFGARHWRWDADPTIARAAFAGGASAASTDAGAATAGKQGMGTIPHALENIMAAYYGYDRAVLEATKAFDRHMDPAIPRIALIDYANREIDDTLATADALEGRLAAVRVDTCGENVAQGAAAEHERPYWGGTGVTVTGVYELRRALDTHGHRDVGIILTSGFGKPDKVKAFVEAEQELGIRLFDGLGVGGVFDARMSTMDIVAVGADYAALASMSKRGRTYHPNPRLQLV